jgi:hypothetical protein
MPEANGKQKGQYQMEKISFPLRALNLSVDERQDKGDN